MRFPLRVAEPALNLLLNQPLGCPSPLEAFSFWGPDILYSCHTTPWRGRVTRVTSLKVSLRGNTEDRAESAFWSPLCCVPNQSHPRDHLRMCLMREVCPALPGWAGRGGHNQMTVSALPLARYVFGHVVSSLWAINWHTFNQVAFTKLPSEI